MVIQLVGCHAESGDTIMAGTEPADDTAQGDDTAPTGTPPLVVRWTNPLMEVDFPDPFILRAEDGYYAYSTNAHYSNVGLARSDDLSAWEYVGDALPQLPEWAASGQYLTWAPGVSR